MVSAQPSEPYRLDQPSCLCGTTMDVAKIEPHPRIKHAEVWTFECRACGHTLRQTFGADEEPTGLL
jgi:hypothetical protein